MSNILDLSDHCATDFKESLLYNTLPTAVEGDMNYTCGGHSHSWTLNLK